ncbi:Glucose-6-phosphate 1-epimerase [Zancudomyces culisetae]|uniref:glucose-6-phosphate 1-epimerase n=1 Tax=Zancudomyces culisetae TaxID=1213189 RepID=A0A1R1PRJ5_ZANCU|nr:Glucose-6-phosphate 1-epimerase [Zancudomyces culisetae]OMH83574.1 Glucose-6-phosphate 1-epimerase [Zancudomyces culisetae]|eukprot:OMH78631.1 Glucose-6-phosphate 1-epimerase [Zancudomyces culisetae]
MKDLVNTITDKDGNVVKVSMTNNEGSSVTIHTYGATIISWICKGEEQLFLSKKAVLDGTKAIRGGIPVVFPQFGPGALPQHGFARTTVWEFLGYKVCQSGIRVKFLLKHNANTLSTPWGYKFKLYYTIELTKNSLELTLECTNLDDVPLEYTTLLHTYFRADIDQTKVHGLEGLKYNDMVAKSSDSVETGKILTISERIDRSYKNTPEIVKVEVGNGRKIEIKSNNFKDTGMYIYAPFSAFLPVWEKIEMLYRTLLH